MYGRTLITAATLVAATLLAGSLKAQGLAIPHPDDAAKVVEYFLQKPRGKGPWPTIVFLHGHQENPRPGGQDFVSWGVLNRFANLGYLAVSVSQPGYGRSSGPPDFCGPRTQHAVSAVITKLVADGDAARASVVIEGISRGALVAGLIAASDPSIAGIVLISGLFDLPRFAVEAKTLAAKSAVESIRAETGGEDAALRARSVLESASKIRSRVLILNGEKDDRTSPQQARLLADRINSHGGKARAIVFPEYGHQIPVQVRDSVIEPFIETVLKR